MPAQEEGVTVSAVFGDKMVLCLATMRLNSDATFGFKESAASNSAEIAILTVGMSASKSEQSNLSI